MALPYSVGVLTKKKSRLDSMQFLGKKIAPPTRVRTPPKNNKSLDAG